MIEVRFNRPGKGSARIPDDYSVAEIKAKGLNHWKGWRCTVGMNCMYIDFDQQVWRGPCRVGEPLGNMLSDWTLPEEEIVCTRDTCDCGSSIKLPKKNDDTFLIPISPMEAFFVQWDLGRRCNFDCSYCWPSSHNKTDEWVNIDALKLVVDKIDRARGRFPIQFNFAGGEPTLHPNFVELCEYIWEMGHRIHVQTNGTAGVRKMQQLAHFAEISISCHFEFMNPHKAYRNIRAVLAENGKLEVKMMVTPDPKSFEKMWDFKRFLETIPEINRARVIVSPLRDPVTNDLMGYTPRQVEEFGDVEF